MAPIDMISILVSEELDCRSKRLLERRHKQAQFRDTTKHLDNFDFQFNPRMNRSLVFDLATADWVGRREDSLFLGPPGSGKSHIAQAIGHAVLQQGYRVLYREAHALLEELADATLDGQRKQHLELLTTVPLLIIDDLGMRKLPLTRRNLTIEIWQETRNPLPASRHGKPQRVSITDSFGASPASSALDHSARRDPGGASTTLTRILKP
jgi:DNA replication protein DnaC